MHRNVSILIVALTVIVIFGYLLWLRTKFPQANVLPQPTPSTGTLISPTMMPTDTPMPSSSPSATPKISPTKAASSSGTKR